MKKLLTKIKKFFIIVSQVKERSDNMWILETRDGDRWTYDENELENARRDKYIFGGEITHIEEE